MKIKKEFPREAYFDKAKWDEVQQLIKLSPDTWEAELKLNDVIKPVDDWLDGLILANEAVDLIYKAVMNWEFTDEINN